MRDGRCSHCAQRPARISICSLSRTWSPITCIRSSSRSTARRYQAADQAQKAAIICCHQRRISRFRILRRKGDSQPGLSLSRRTWYCTSVDVVSVDVSLERVCPLCKFDWTLSHYCQPTQPEESITCPRCPQAQHESRFAKPCQASHARPLGSQSLLYKER